MFLFFFNDTATTKTYTYGDTLSLHDALPIYFGSNTLGYTDAALQAPKYTYKNLLPSLTLAYQVGNDIVVRFAAAKVMQRPDMNLLAAASSPSAPTVPPPDQEWRGNLRLGNPALKPYLANQFDLSFEWYLGKRGLLARSEEHTSELQSLMRRSYAVFCL